MAEDEFVSQAHPGLPPPGCQDAEPELERYDCAEYWKEQFTELDALVRRKAQSLLSEADFKRYKLMQDFAHRVGDVLALIADTLQPRTSTSW